MNYYKFNEPYYALIRAKTKDKAMKMYTQYIAELECIKAIEKAHDILSLQNGYIRPPICGEEISNTLNNSEECILLLDGDLQ